MAHPLYLDFGFGNNGVIDRDNEFVAQGNVGDFDSRSRRANVISHGLSSRQPSVIISPIGSQAAKLKERLTQFDDNRSNNENNISRDNSTVIPEYILELYEKSVKLTSSVQLDSNIVRSFKNIAQEESRRATTVDEIRHSKDRVHSLIFDISSLDPSESLNSAELRLYTLIKRDQRSYTGVSRIVTIFEIIRTEIAGNTIIRKRFLTSKYIENSADSWESFDVTGAVKRSVQSGSTREHLEVRFESTLDNVDEDEVDINSDPSDKKQPILVVYSNDKSHHHEQLKDRHELLMHKVATRARTSLAASSMLTEDSDESISKYDYNTQDYDHKRFKRSRHRDRGAKPCRRRPMYVSFDDIGYNNWILFPKGYQAYQCSGQCYVPLDELLTPSKHAIIQSLVHLHHPKRVDVPCCVPTKLDPISIIYIDLQGVVTYKYNYDEMVVAECGCR